MKKLLVLMVGCLVPIVGLAELPAALDKPLVEPAPASVQVVPAGS